MIAGRIPGHLEVAAALGVMAEELAAEGNPNLADRARALAGLLGYQATSPRRPFAPSDRLDDFAAALRANPGEWEVWPNKHNEITARVASSRINRGADLRFSGGKFEAVSRLGVLHVRYIGEEKNSA